MENKLKMVNFNWACPRCIHKDVPETKDPCNVCLAQPVNENSHKPVNYIPENKYKEDKP